MLKKTAQWLNLQFLYDNIPNPQNSNQHNANSKELRASLKTRLIKEKTDRYGSRKETFRRRAAALQGRLTKQLICIAAFSQKGFLEMPLKEMNKNGCKNGAKMRYF